MIEDTVQIKQAGHFKLGGVYWNSEEELPFTVTEIRFRHIDSEIFITTADLDYPCYSQTERVRRWARWLPATDFPELWAPADGEVI
jgi:hypothetical protein